jgi:hypothetical protein
LGRKSVADGRPDCRHRSTRRRDCWWVLPTLGHEISAVAACARRNAACLTVARDGVKIPPPRFATRWGKAVDFIERIFGISPNGGSGSRAAALADPARRNRLSRVARAGRRERRGIRRSFAWNRERTSGAHPRRLAALRQRGDRQPESRSRVRASPGLRQLQCADPPFGCTAAT